MMKATLITALGLAAALGVAEPAAAMPVAPVDNGASPLIQVYGGCGPYGHRGPWGGCRAGGQWGGGYRVRRACPPGWHIGYAGRRCWPNRY